jgi:ATP phosphoribosyltransferase regulatory subunit
MVMATAALADLGVRGLSVDLGLPTLVPAIIAATPLEARVQRRLRIALDRKDVAAIAALEPVLGAATAELLARLAATGGPAEPALAAISALDLPDAAAAERAHLLAVTAGLTQAAPELTLTIDAVEHRGFEYHTGVTYAVFAAGAPHELARGGRYRTEAGEAATGITLFMDAVLRAMPRPESPRRVLLAAGTSAEAALALRRKGWVALSALDTGSDPAAEASRLGCGFVFCDGEIRPLSGGAPSPVEG